MHHPAFLAHVFAPDQLAKAGIVFFCYYYSPTLYKAFTGRRFLYTFILNTIVGWTIIYQPLFFLFVLLEHSASE